MVVIQADDKVMQYTTQLPGATIPVSAPGCQTVKGVFASNAGSAAPAVQIISGDPPRQPKSLPEPKVVHVLKRGAFDQPGAVAGPIRRRAECLCRRSHVGKRFAARLRRIRHRAFIMTQGPNNVIGFRSSSTGSLSALQQRCIEALRETSQRNFDPLLAELFDKIDDAFFGYSERAVNTDSQLRFFEAMREIRRHRQPCVQTFYTDLNQRLTDFTAGTLKPALKEVAGNSTELSLVEDEQLERQLAETEAKQKRDVESVKAREMAEMMKVQEEERLKAERAKITADEEIAVATQNKDRQVLVAQRNKERTDAVEVERVTRDRDLEIIERQRITTLKDIEKEKAVEVEKKNIQEVIKDRVALEKTVVVEQQKMKDTEAFATADREKQVALTNAEKNAQEQLIQKIKEAEAAKQAAQLAAEQAAFTAIKAAEAAKQAAELHAQELLTLAEAKQEASSKEAAAEKALAEAVAAKAAAPGLGEAQVLLAKAEASQKQGTVDAEVTQLKLAAEADGITKKAQAMKLLEDAGRQHEEFKLNLDKDKAVALAEINIQKDIAAAQAGVLGEAMKSAKIEIVGGESQFFDKITSAIGTARAVDRMVEGSRTLTDVKETFFNGDPDYFKAQLKTIVDQFGLTAEDTKNLTLSALFAKLIGLNPDAGTLNKLTSMIGAAGRFGLTEQTVAGLLASKAKK